MTRALAVGVLVLVCVGSAPALAGGGLRIDVAFLEGAASGPATKQVERAVMWLGDRRVRLEQRSPEGKPPQPDHQKLPEHPEQVVIYRGDRGLLYSLSPADQTYLQVDRRTIVAMGRRLDAARRAMETRLVRLPKDQRAMAELLIGTRDLPAAEVAHAVSRTGNEETLLGRRCHIVAIRRGERLVGDACIVPWDELGLSQEDVGVLRELANFQRELMGARGLTPLALVTDQPLEFLTQLGGLPLRYRKLKGGRETSSIRITALDTQAPADDLFEVPAGYTAANDLPTGGAPASR